MNRIALLASVVCAIILTSLASCSSIGAEQPLRSASYPLAEHQLARLSPTVSVRYERFDDSRCPKESACIWAGKLNYHFMLTSSAGNERFALDAEGKRFVSKVLPGVNFAMSLAGVRGRPAAEHAVVLEVGVDTAHEHR